MATRTASYPSLNLGVEPGSLKTEIRPLLGQLRGIIFDCDGVLIDAKQSYDQAIVKTVTFFAERLIGKPFPKELITVELLAGLRYTGGFNNDWDTCYVILLGLFSGAPLPQQERFLGLLRTDDEDDATILGRLRPRPTDYGALLPVADRTLRRIVEVADASGPERVEAELLRSDAHRDALLGLKKFLGYPGGVGQGLLATVFNEFFYGPRLFRQAHRLEARFYRGSGLIKNEKPLVSPDTLRLLAEIVGRTNLGIASGRGSLATQFTLQGLWGFFNPEAMVFIEDDEAANRSTGASRGPLNKPEAYALLKAARGLPAGPILYVGDSAEDLIMVQRANSNGHRFLFGGIYGSAYDPAARARMFVERGADLILPSVASLPTVLDSGRVDA